jgi:thiamine phosphate synthase YjbQ (UPF0047 family)
MKDENTNELMPVKATELRIGNWHRIHLVNADK